MKQLNTEKEWDFIKYQINYNKPEKTPYEGKDLLKRELLFGLRTLLIEYQHEKNKLVRNTIYNLTKAFYIDYNV